MCWRDLVIIKGHDTKLDRNEGLEDVEGERNGKISGSGGKDASGGTPPEGVRRLLLSPPIPPEGGDVLMLPRALSAANSCPCFSLSPWL